MRGDAFELVIAKGEAVIKEVKVVLNIGQLKDKKKLVPLLLKLVPANDPLLTKGVINKKIVQILDRAKEFM